MKFRKTVTVDNISEARRLYCAERAEACSDCAVINAFGSEHGLVQCDKNCRENPRKAAEIMGYEAIDETPPLDISNWTLAQAKEYCEKHKSENITCDYKTCMLMANRICSDVVSKWELNKKRLTQKEKEICKALDAKWLSRDKGADDFVCLWYKKPQESQYGNFEAANADAGCISADKFPSLRPGDCICVSEDSDYVRILQRSRKRRFSGA